MKQVKTILVSLAVGIAVGLWFGVNVGREQPFYSNPFDASSLNQKLKKATGETLEKAAMPLKKPVSPYRTI